MMLFTRTGRLLPLIAGLTTCLLSSCDLLEFSPNDVRAPADERDLTQQNLTRLAQQPVPTGGDTLRFAFTSDPQRAYDELDPMIASLQQQRRLAMLLVGGDISDFGLSREMRWVNEKLRQLPMPYLTVIGNHDMVGNGRAAYQEVFGPLNYTFTYAATRFIFINTNSREYGFNGQVPDVAWLRQQLADTVGVRRQIVMCHVPPGDGDFDSTLVAPYVRALAAAPRLALHLSGHNSKFYLRQSVEKSFAYVSGYEVPQHRYLVFTLWGVRDFTMQPVAY